MNVLKKDKRLYEGNNLNKPLLFELLETYDKKLFELLISDKKTREKYFIKIGESYVFKYEDFRLFIEQNNLDGSHTKYENTIGLSNRGKFLSESTDYVLNWPFKDTVLEGGMSSEEDEDTYIEKKVEKIPGKMDKKTATVISTEKTEVSFSEVKGKREEIFYNNIIAEDEIDKLLDKKALKNFKRYTAKGEEEVKEIKRDEDGTIKENLLIKGNNLLALHSLKEQFAGKVKLIYIDPPYNTGKDGFGYNDRFNHSTWLTFMKNRLEIAKELLRDDGAIIISIDDIEQPYLRALLDQDSQKLFGSDNFLVNGVVNRPSEIATNNTIQKHEYYLIYTKNHERFKVDSLKKETISRGTVGNLNQTMPTIEFPSGLNCYGIKDGIYKETRKIEGSQENIENLNEIVVKNGKLDKPVKLKAKWRSSNDMRRFFKNNCNPTEAKINGIITEIYFENDRFNPQIKKETYQKIPSLFLDNKRGSKDLEQIGMKNIFGYPKSEFFLKFLIDIITKENDLILDFTLGSATTTAVAHKLNRQYIGIEQDLKFDEKGVRRMNKVLEGIEGGISKEVDWKGGGDFIYLELSEYNEEAKNKIDSCKTYKDLKKLFVELTDNYFLNYNVSIKEFNEKILNDKDFEELPLDEQKTLFKALLDNNQLYISYDEQDDPRFNLSKEDRKVTEMFYE